MSDEDFGDLIAQLDQARRALSDFAGVVASYYRDLREEGFTPEEALVLAVDMQRLIYAGGQS